MSYSNPITTTIVNPVEQDFGAGTGTAWSFKGPTGKKGMLIDVGVFVTETFEDDTAPTAGVAIGTTGDADAYALLEVADGTALTDTFNIQDDTDAIIAQALPADTQIECTQIAAADSGTAAGKGYPYVVVEWY